MAAAPCSDFRLDRCRVDKPRAKATGTFRIIPQKRNGENRLACLCVAVVSGTLPHSPEYGNAGKARILANAATQRLPGSLATHACLPSRAGACKPSAQRVQSAGRPAIWTEAWREPSASAASGVSTFVSHPQERSHDATRFTACHLAPRVLAEHRPHGGRFGAGRRAGRSPRSCGGRQHDPGGPDRLWRPGHRRGGQCAGRQERTDQARGHGRRLREPREFQLQESAAVRRQV
jgi:hypothetical protein